MNLLIRRQFANFAVQPTQQHDLDTDPLPLLPGNVNLMILLARAIEFHSPLSMSWTGWSFLIIIAFLCLMASAFVSGSEIAYFGLTGSQIEDLGEEDDANSRKAFTLISNSERLLATILISNNLVNITMVVLLTFAIQQAVTFTSGLVNFLSQTVLLTFLLLLFGEIFPKLVARGRIVAWVRKAAPGIMFLYKLLAPFSRLMVKSSVIVNRLVSKRPEEISTEELSHALEISDLGGEKDKEMLEGILTFGGKDVSDIMISRVDVTSIEYHQKFPEVIDVILRSGYSRIPVYDTSQDTIRGVLYAKDLLPYIQLRDDDSFQWQALLRDAYFVPDSRMIDDLLEDFRKKKIHIAIVVDEYGATRGIVTLEDIIEEIVGDIDDEYDNEDKTYRRLPDGVWIFKGKTPLTYFCRATGIDEERLGENAEEAETLAGLLLDLKGDFPEEKESFSLGGIDFTVLRIERHRIISVKVRINE